MELNAYNEDTFMQMTSEAAEHFGVGRVCYARRIYIGAVGETFERVFLRPFLSLYPAYRLQGYILDLSSTGELERSVQHATTDLNAAKGDLHVARARVDDHTASEILTGLVHDCDPGVRPNEVTLDLDPRRFPKVAGVCRAVASRWFFGRGAAELYESWPYSDVVETLDMDVLRDRLSRRWHPRRPTFLLMATYELRLAFAEALASRPWSWMSFVQLAEPCESPRELWPWQDAPSVVLRDEEASTVLERQQAWGTAVSIVATKGALATADRLMGGTLTAPGRRLQLPEVVALWSPGDDQMPLVWVIQPLKRRAKAEDSDAYFLGSVDRYQRREDLEKAIDTCWQIGRPRVLCLVGLGGTGKTALMQRFLKSCALTADVAYAATTSVDVPSADAAFIWSFYARPYAETFLRHFAGYLTGGGPASGSAEESLHQIVTTLQSRHLRRVLLVMDGIETIQRASNSTEGVFQSSLIVKLLDQVASGALPLVAFLTSRLAPRELKPRSHDGYAALDVGSLMLPAARQLLAACGVRGDDRRLDDLAERFHRHALTLHHLGRFIGDYCDGDPDAADRLPSLERVQKADDAEVDRINQDFMRVLARYEDRLPKTHVAILQRVAVLGTPLTVDQFADIFVGSQEKELAGPLAGLSREMLQSGFDELESRQLVDGYFVQGAPKQYSTHPAIAHYFGYALAADAAVDTFHKEASDYFKRQLGNDPLSHDSTHATVRTRGAIRTRGASVGARARKTEYPSDSITLDLLEKVVYHTVRAGRSDEARRVYDQRMGGDDHLVAIGERPRAERINAWLGPTSSQRKH